MAELLLELLSEEIPARMQARGAEDLKRLVAAGLKDAGLDFDRAEAFVTPRRLALVVGGLPKKQPDLTEERKGPRTDAPEKAIDGFLRSAGLTLDQCETREVKGRQHYFAVIKRKGRPTAEVIAEMVPRVVPEVPWPKSMRWGGNQIRWVRPLHNLLAVFDGRVVKTGLPLGMPGPRQVVLAANAKTVGHRFHAPKAFKVKDFADYEKKLREAKVLLDQAERRAKILADARGLAKKAKLTLVEDEGLIAEVTGLVEWPVVLSGAIDPAFMDLPDEVLTTVMRSHQKYFSLVGKDGRLAPRFIVVANTEAADGGARIAAGNERVLRARLADARYFWDQDRKRSLESRLPVLESLVFHEKLGSMAAKTARLQGLVAELAWRIPGTDAALAERAALLAKADLTTEMVGEFPELQGVMGRYYALLEGARPAVANAIAEHYAPQGPGDACPSAPVSVAVALADKIDTLVGFWGIGERPTGSKDPFALRRAALGVIRLIVENGLRVPLVGVFKAASDLYRGDGGANPLTCEADALARDLLAFFADRLKVYLREKGVRHDLIAAVFALTGEDDLVRLLARVDALQRFLETDDGANLLVAYKRAANIVRIEQKKDGRAYNGEFRRDLLVEEDEKKLAGCLDAAMGGAKDALAAEDFQAAMAALARLRRPVDDFFDHVLVNTDDAGVRDNRLRLLSRIGATLNEVADFSQIEGGDR